MSVPVPHELNRADKRILRCLDDQGDRNPKWLADHLDYNRKYIHQRLQILCAAEYVDNIGCGLYQLAELPPEVR